MPESNEYSYHPSRSAMTAGEAISAFIACVLWGTAFPTIKISLQWMPPLGFAADRFMLAGLMIFILYRGRGFGFVFRKRFKLALAVGLLQTTFLYGLFFVGMVMVQGAKGAIIVGSSPWLNMILAHWMMRDDRFDLSKLIVFVIGCCGLCMLAVGRDSTGAFTIVDTREIFGMSLLMLGNFGSALGGILVARAKHDFNPVSLNAVQMFTGGAVLAVAAVFAGQVLPEKSPPPIFYPLFIWTAIISAVSFSVWFVLLKRIKVSYLNMFKCLIPVFGATLSWILLPDESPTAMTITGMALAAFAVLLSQYFGYKSSVNGNSAKP